jgi:probable HAF family extracellular repeat protein
MQRITHSGLRWGEALCGLLTWGTVLLVSAPVHAELYSVTALDTSGGPSPFLWGINDAGQIIGQASNGQAVKYSNGTMTGLGTLGGFTNSVATGINEAGQVVGYAYNANINFNITESQAFVFSNGTMTGLGTLGGYTNSRATGINEAGQVVGTASTTGNTDTQAFIYSNGTMTGLGGVESRANGINDAGVVVGTTNLPPDNRGAPPNHLFTYSDGTMSVHPSLNPDNRWNSIGPVPNNAINNRGQVLIEALCCVDQTSIFRYENQTLDRFSFGGRGHAFSMNNYGQIVGSDGQLQDLHAVAVINDTLFDLNSLLDGTGSGLFLQEARAINDRGQILALARGGQYVLLNPYPAPIPAAFLLFGTGLIGLVGWQRKRLSKMV